MSRPQPRKSSAARVQPRERKSPSRDPITPSGLFKQKQREKDELDDIEEFPDNVVPATPNETSDGRHRMRSQNVQTTSSTSASPGQHSVEQPNETDDHQKRQSAVPQAEIPDSRSSQNDTPAPELLEGLHAAQRELLELWILKFEREGFPRTVVFKEVVQAINEYFPSLKWDQSEPTQPQQTGTGPAQAGATERRPDLENRPSASTSNNMRESQHGSKSPRDATDSRLHRGEATSSRLTTPLPVNEKGKSTATRLKVRGLKSVKISNEQEFLEAFRKYGLRDITPGKAGEPVIKLLDLARETVEDVKPKFQERQRELGEVWQVLFTIIANMFVCGPEPLYHTVKALSKQFSTGPNERARQHRRHSNNAVAREFSESLEELTDSMRWWWLHENRSHAQLEKVHAYYKKLKTVEKYDAMMTSWQENEEFIQGFYQDMVGEHQNAAKCILEYIAKQITRSRKKAINDEIINKLSDKISGFRPICSLVDSFGKGVLVLLVDNPENYVLGKVGEGQELTQHETIRDVAESLCKVDSMRHNGQLCTLFTDLEKKVLKPVTLLFEGGNTGSLVHDCPRKRFFDDLDVGQRISHILKLIGKKKNTDTGSDIMTTQGTTTQGRQPLSKRTMSHHGMEEAVDGEQGTSKRQRTESGEDEESRQDGPSNNPDPEEDLYNP